MTKHQELIQLLEAAVDSIGGSKREGQITLAKAINRAIESKTHILAQAGTGTGKSLAYLVSAILYASKAQLPVVVSTATLALQHQLVAKDLPSLAAACSTKLNYVPKFSLLKGRANYLCLYKINGGYSEDDSLFSTAQGRYESTNQQALAIQEQVSKLIEWAKATPTGDRDDVPFEVNDRSWQQVSVFANQCVGSECPFIDRCFAELNREEARHSDIIVTNHALLAISAFNDHEIVPRHEVLIIDEAHEFHDRITSALTESINYFSLRQVSKAARKLALVPSDFEKAAAEMVDYLDQLPAGRLSMDPRFKDLVNAVAVEVKRLLSEIKNLTGSKEQQSAGDKKVAKSHLTQLFQALEVIVDPSEDHVVYISRSEIQNISSINVSPLTIATQMRHKILSSTTTIFTSATLAFGGRFEYPAAALGLYKADQLPDISSMPSFELSALAQNKNFSWVGIDVGSAFNYAKQGILYIAKHLMPPTLSGINDENLAHLVELIEASEGGALALFSSRKAALEAVNYVRENSSYPVLFQDDDSLSTLVNKFRDDFNASLFGTKALWQGVDVQGLSCRLVIIDRIPFPRPDDPIATARQDKIKARGGNWFVEDSLQSAALLLAQGSGRLIRSVDDKGVVAVLDSRLATKHYRQFLLKAIPPMWGTYDPQITISALNRLAAKNI